MFYVLKYNNQNNLQLKNKFVQKNVSNTLVKLTSGLKTNPLNKILVMT